MSIRNTLSTAAVALLGVAAFAHHVDVPLSHVSGTEVLTDVVYYAQPGVEGVPAYRMGTDDHEVLLPDGAGFSVADHHGTLQSYTHSEHGDHHSLEQFAAAINGQLTIARAEIVNSTLFLRGVEGGAGATLELIDGPALPLTALGIPEGVNEGSDDVRLTISLAEADEHEHPGDDHIDALAHHPYVVVASTTPGEIVLGELTLPLGYDATLQNTLRAIQAGLLPGFAGELDHNEDAEAILPAATLQAMFPGGLPEQLYLAFEVLDVGPEPEVLFVSNRFTVHMQD